MSMTLIKNESYVEVPFIDVVGTTICGDDDSESDAVALEFENGAFILKEGDTAEIKLDEGTSSICNITPKCIFTSATITVDNGRVFISVMEVDGVLSNYTFIISELMTDISFGNKRR